MLAVFLPIPIYVLIILQRELEQQYNIMCAYMYFNISILLRSIAYYDLYTDHAIQQQFYNDLVAIDNNLAYKNVKCQGKVKPNRF